MSLIARLGVVLGLNSEEFVRGLENANNRTKDFKKTLAQVEANAESFKGKLALAQGALVGFGIAAVHHADDISDLAKAYDLTTESILEYRDALIANGSDAENSKKIIAAFSTAVDNAVNGNKELKDTFVELGISTHDLGFLTNQQLMEKAFQGLSQIDDNIRRSAVSVNIFSKAIKGTDLKGMAISLEESKGKFKGQGEAIDKAAEAWQKLELALEAAEIAAAKALQPLMDLAEHLPGDTEIDRLANAFVGLGEVLFAAFAIRGVAGIAAFGAELTALSISNPVLFAVLTGTTLAALASNYADKNATNMAGEEGGGLTFKLGGAFAGDRPLAGQTEGYAISNPLAKIGNQKFPSDLSVGEEKKRDVKLSKEELAIIEKQRAEYIKIVQEFQKKNNLLQENLKNQKDDLLLQLDRKKYNEDDFAVAEKKLQNAQAISKLEKEKTREIAAAQAEYDASKADEKSLTNLNKRKELINAYYKDAINGQTEINSLSLQKLNQEIELKNKYQQQDLQNQLTREIDSITMKHDAEMQLLNLEGEAYKLSTNDYNLQKLKIDAAQQLADVQTKYAEKRKALQTEFERTSQGGKDRELFEQRIKDLEYLQRTETNALDEINNKREDNFQKEIERQQSWAAGWDDAMKKYVEASERASDRGRAAFESVTSNMETAIRRFVDTGKFAFKDFVGSVIKDLIYMEARAQASMILRSIISSFSGMVGSGGGTDTGSAGKIAGDLFGSHHAAGGLIDRPSIVGENGAELFIPKTAGTIIPHGSWQQMAAAGSNNNGGITVNGNYIANMSAIDTQSATQFLAKNKSAVWASYQSANRSVPISR